LALALGLAVADGPRAAAAADVVDYEACVVERRPSAALMAMVMDRTLFELDLRSVPATPFALQPDDCVVVTGIDRGSGAGLRREFPRADWLIEAVAISSIEDRVNRGSPAGSPD
jgi:hypothetical protein